MLKPSAEHRHTALERVIKLIRATQIDREITRPRYERGG
jgi:hypothetical protein